MLPEVTVDLLVVLEYLVVRKAAVNDDRVVQGHRGNHAHVQHVTRLEDVGLVRHTCEKASGSPVLGCHTTSLGLWRRGQGTAYVC